MKERIADYILTYPKRCVAFCLFIFIGLSIFLPSLKEDYSIRIWFQDTDPLIEQLDRMEKIFGNDETIAIGIHIPNTEGGVLTPQGIQLVREVTEEAWKLPFVISVSSLTNIPHSRIERDELLIEPFFQDNLELTPELLKSKRAVALDDPILTNQFINKKGDTTLIFASLRPELAGEVDYQELTSALDNLTSKFEAKTNAQFILAGTAVLSDTYRKLSRTDLIKVLPAMIIFVVIILLIAFHSITAVILFLSMISLTILASFGLASLIGIEFNNISSAVPGVLLAICLADGVHLYVSYTRRLKMQLDRHQALRDSMIENFVPTLLTTLSTVLGFLSLSTAELLPVKNLGILAGFGTLYAWFLTFFFVAPLTLLLPGWELKALRKSKLGLSLRSYLQQSRSDVTSKKVLDFIGRYKTSLIVFFTLLTVASIFLGLENEVNSEPLKQISSQLKVRKDSEYLRDQFQGYNGPHIMVDSGLENGVKDPKFLKKIEKLIEQIEKDPYVNRVNSIVRLIKKTNQNLHQGNLNFYRIPDDRKSLAETLLFYEMSLPQEMNLNNRISLDGRYLRLSILWSYSDSRNSLKQIEKIAKMAKELGLEVQVTGKMMLYYRMTSYIVSTFFQSISLAFILITLMMMVALRSFRLGFLALLPNIIPLAIGLGVMTLLRMPIDMASSMIVTICLGIAVDDTVHFLSHFYQQRRKGNDVKKSLENVLRDVSPALILTTFILSTSFALFLLGDFIPNANFGIMSSLILAIALLVDLILLPAILLKFKGFSR